MNGKAMDESSRDARLAIDIGGTFTDVALEAGGRLVTTKVLTTAALPERGVLEGVHKVLGLADVTPSAVRLVIHGTTLATNAIIERRGARTALIVTSGHRDALEMAHENRFEQYDIGVDRPPPLVPRRLRLPVEERVDHRGRVLVPLEEGSVRALLPTLEAAGVESVAVGLIHGYANPDHERRIGEILDEWRPGLPVTLASDVCPEVREYERQSTACANAYVQPLMARYLTGPRGFAAGVGVRVSLPSHDLGGRAHDARYGGRRSGPSRGIRTRRGGDPRQPSRAGRWNWATSSPSTWAGRRRSCVSSMAGSRSIRGRSRSPAATASSRGAGFRCGSR